MKTLWLVKPYGFVYQQNNQQSQRKISRELRSEGFDVYALHGFGGRKILDGFGKIIKGHRFTGDQLTARRHDFKRILSALPTTDFHLLLSIRLNF